MAGLTRSAFVVTAIVVIMYGGCCVLLFTMQRSLLYFPPTQTTAVRNSDTTLVLPADGASLRVSIGVATGARAILYFGGNGEDVTTSMPLLIRAYPDDAVFAMHYRGFTGSTGAPSENALIADAQLLFDYVHHQHLDIVVIGRSLGSGIAIHLASLRPVSRLILITPYDSIQELAARQFPFFPVRWLLLDKFESWRYASHILAPTLLIAAQYDKVVPMSSTRLLYHQLPKDLVKLKVISDADHNSISQTTEYLSLLKSGAE